jgi:hypothetical protein
VCATKSKGQQHLISVRKPDGDNLSCIGVHERIILKMDLKEMECESMDLILVA